MNANIDISGVVLTTERLRLRPWRPEDLEDLFAYASVDGVGQMAGWPPHTSRAVSQKILGGFIAGKKTFALEYRGRVVGSLGIERYDEAQFPQLADVPCREIGYVLARDCWGQGLMPEAVRAVLRWLFTEAGLEAVLCGHSPRNRQSARVQEKCGLRPFGVGHYHTQLGTMEESEFTILWREEWQRAQAR